MMTLLIIICVFLIAIVLLQAGKAESLGALTGGNDSLFKNRKERGGELFITRLTLILGILFILISMYMGF